MSHDVSASTFQTEVIERSKSVPVVVDFWAPWCGPCRTLGPVLERLEGQAQGQWELVKVNTDENQGLSQRFEIRGIPAVKAFVDGKVVAEFVGAQPEPQVKQFLAKLVPEDPRKRENDVRGRFARDALPLAEAQAHFDHEESVATTYALGRSLAAAGQWDAALGKFFHVVQRDRAYQADAGRKAMLEVFDALPADSRLADQWRRMLSTELFK